MSGDRDPLGYLELPVPPGFVEYGGIREGWRYSYADRNHQALSLRARSEDLSGLAQLPPDGLWKLVCRHCPITDDDFDTVVRFDHLEDLDLTKTRITDRATATMHTLQRLRVLSLASTAVTNAALDHVAALRSLEHLDISDTAIDDDGLRALAFHPHLRILNVRKSGVTGEAFAPLLTTPELRQIWVTSRQHHHARRFSKERPEVELLY
jgi:hypothetical protein